MMNIEVLLEGTRLGGPRSHHDKSPDTWTDMAVAHARMVAKHHMRPDGSTHHVVEYNPVRGTVNRRYTYQGHAHESTWSRGQAWAMAGFAKMYAATRKPEFLRAAEALSDKWLGLLSAQSAPGPRGGWVPKWDFNAPFDMRVEGPMDSSAAAVAALAFLQLAEAEGNGSTCGRRFLCAGANTLRALAAGQYLARADGRGGAVLKHGTGNRPADAHINTGLIFGDYYLLKALSLCRRIPGCADA
jgi:unsaturated chondroitin disaccharide hydrolase